MRARQWRPAASECVAPTALPHLFRFRFEERGGHTHVRLFAGNGTSSLGLCGALVFRNDEWASFVAEVERAITGDGRIGTCIEFFPED